MSRRLRAIVSRALEHLTRPQRRRRFRMATRSSPLKLNVGAGSVRLDGWLSTDVTRSSICYLDVTQPWPVAPESVSHIYADNMIEHLDLDEARRFLRHAHKALRRGGTIRIATPDIEGIARLYLDPSGRGEEHLDRHRRHGYHVEHRVDLLNLVYLSSGHSEGYLYDFAALHDELRHAGFTDVRRFSAGRSDDPELRDLEQRTDPTDDLASLIVEATCS